MQIEIRSQILELLNLQYMTDTFHSPVRIDRLVEIAKQALCARVNQVNYELDSAIMAKYCIRLPPSTVLPFEPKELAILENICELSKRLLSLKDSAPVTEVLKEMNEIVKRKEGRVRVTPHYRNFALHFRYVDIKEALLYTVLSQCQIWFIICKERKKSGKQFHLDPLIQYFEQIPRRHDLSNMFHFKVLPRKQMRHIEKKILSQRANNPLFDAVSQGDYALTKKLILEGANIDGMALQNDRNNRQMCCAHKACMNGDLEMCRVLSSFGVNWESEDNEKMSPVFYAVQSGTLVVLRYLTEQINVNLQKKEIQNRTPFYFACTDGNIDTIRYLHSRGVEINNKSHLGRTALSKACYLGKLDVVIFLLSCKGINAESEDVKGRTALHNAVFGPKGGREGHKFGTNNKDSPQCAQLLLLHGCNVDYPDLEGNTPLHVAMSSEAIDSIRLLIAYGASLTKLNKYGETPLMTGSKFGHVQSIKILYEYNSSVLEKDIFGKNLILLCAKFRELNEDGTTSLNSAFRNLLDKIIEEVWHKGAVESDKSRMDLITDARAQFDFTFKELLFHKVSEEFLIFVQKCIYNKIPFPTLSLEELQQLIELYQSLLDPASKSLIESIMLRDRIQITPAERRSFLSWVFRKNNIAVLQFLKAHQQMIVIGLESGGCEWLFEDSFEIIFEMLPVLKEKFLTHLLLVVDIDWLTLADKATEQNILHLLVKGKKIGTLIQVVKLLSGKKLPFIQNRYLTQIVGMPQQLAAANYSLLSHRDRDGFDPYQLALVMKEASAIKILEERNKEFCHELDQKWDVKDYRVELQEDIDQLEIFKLGHQREHELALLIQQISTIDQQQFKQIFPFVDNNKTEFSTIWLQADKRPLQFVNKLSQIPLLGELLKESIVGIDIQYFCTTQNVTLISIMQISSISKDFIIDLLSSSTEVGAYATFIHTLRDSFFAPLAYNPRIWKVMHGCDNDLCILKSVLNVSLVGLADTSRIDIDIRKQASVRGLSTLVGEYLGCLMSKDFQVSEWRIRPIPQAMIDYARRDSFVLPFLFMEMLGKMEFPSMRDSLANGCAHAKRNKRGNQLLIHNIVPH